MARHEIELLSPAGDEEKLRLAVLYGADAVYLGGGALTMRDAARGSFQGEALRRAVSTCHERGVRVYLAYNTLPRNEETDGLEASLREAAEAGVDALIVTDIGVMMTARRLAPHLPLHVSTQAGVVNWRAAAELWRLGARRVVLARELSLEEIRVIRERTPTGLELEAFVHGSLCMAVSGRCLISDYLAGRDPNRGHCAQPCRWSYRLVEEKRPGEYHPVVEDDRGTWFFNANDLCMIEHLDKLLEAGVTSFKIEGRQKSGYYAAVVTNAYRAACDRLRAGPARYAPPAWAVEETRRVSHRPYGTGFYFGRPAQDYDRGGPGSDWDVAALVEGSENGVLTLRQRNRFRVGDRLEAVSPGEAPRALRVEAMFDEDGAPIVTAPHPTMRVRMPCSLPLPPGSLLRRKRDEADA